MPAAAHARGRQGRPPPLHPNDTHRRSLRRREPDDEINFSVLVYRLSAADLERALLGPPAELGPDVLASEKAKLPSSASDEAP